MTVFSDTMCLTVKEKNFTLYRVVYTPRSQFYMNSNEEESDTSRRFGEFSDFLGK